MSRIDRQPFPPRRIDAGDARDGRAALYLRPIDACRRALAAEDALPLAGGPFWFSRLELMWRDGSGGLCGAGCGIGALRDWADAQSEAVAGEVSDMLARLSAPRAPIAGLAFDQPRIMGVVNVTPDSFSDGGDFADAEAAIDHGRALAAMGADILDVGGESTRPNAEPVDAVRERERIVPVIEALAGDGHTVSVDSRHAEVMAAALDAGAAIVNDVTALAGDPASLALVVERGVPVILMHMRGEPKSMQRDPRYTYAPVDIYDFLAQRVVACAAAGIERARIVLDPGIGFGKTVEHNLQLLANLGLLHGLGCPILVGASRKRFIGTLADENEPKRRLPGSLAAGLAALNQGVQMVRVHDARETHQAHAVWRAIASAG